MKKIERIEELCRKHNLNHARNIFENETEETTLFIDLAGLCAPTALKDFSSDLPDNSSIYYVYAGDDAIEDWQRKLCMAIEC